MATPQKKKKPINVKKKPVKRRVRITKKASIRKKTEASDTLSHDSINVDSLPKARTFMLDNGPTIKIKLRRKR